MISPRPPSMRGSGSLALLVLVVLSSACTRSTATQEPSLTPVASAAVDAAAPTFVAWTDELASTELVKDCHAKAPPHEPVSRGEHDPLLCQVPFRQSCFENPCRVKTDECNRACGTTCRSCDDACVNTCDNCKSGCKDQACRVECAKKTGVCKQACLTAIDRCGSADCAEVARACYDEVKRTWKSHGCSCKKILPCMDACVGDAGKCIRDAACLDKCGTACATKFPGCDIRYCTEGMEPKSD